MVWQIIKIIIQHIDTLPKYGQKTLDVRTLVHMMYIQR